MRSMKIITGKTGTNHVASEDDRGLHRGIVGTGNYVLTAGDCFKITMIDANTARISSGELIMNGCHARIAQGDYDDLVIDSGTTGYNRKDLIVARYTKTGEIEDVALVVIKGATSTGKATAPDYTEGDIYNGDTLVDMPLYEISIEGVNVKTLTPQYVVIPSFIEISNEVSALSSELDGLSSELESQTSELRNQIEKEASSVREGYAEADKELDKAISNVSDNLNELEKRVAKLEQATN